MKLKLTKSQKIINRVFGVFFGTKIDTSCEFCGSTKGFDWMAHVRYTWTDDRATYVVPCRNCGQAKLTD